MHTTLHNKTNEWKKEYPFLSRLWYLFEDFNNESGEGTDLYEPCNDIADRYTSDGQNYKPFCENLFKNLERATISSTETETIIHNKDRTHSVKVTLNPEDDINKNALCSNLNKWLYYYTEINHVPNGLIQEIFEAFDGVVELGPQTAIYNKCTYESYKDIYAEPEDLIKLIIFVENEDIIGNVLMNGNAEEYLSCINYTYECASIYKKLHTAYCNEKKHEDIKYSNLCEEIEGFKEIYQYISRLSAFRKKLPDLDSPLPEFRAAIVSERKARTSTPELTVVPSNPLKSKIATGVTTGFTPVGSWFQARNKGGKENILLDGGPNEMFYNRPDSWNVESDNEKYNIGYQTMEDYSFEHTKW
ncbi:unnamed protein product [Plasmodium vivax]|uniref:(malaria parasite P. vivax) hypothetical protein n=1 Tax=Plasmodium vivax TaxID=5855 RepID=A0A8S4GZS2_PLAVI|nr:unnamed protein product [Plasmodium vivax]